MSKKIFLSPSNQTANNYAYGNTNEAAQCARMAEACRVALERCGFAVKVNALGKLVEKVNESNAWAADLHVCIHTNAHDGKVSGTRMFSYELKGEGYEATKAIFDVLAPITPGTSENIKAKPEFYEIKNTKCPCVYVEVDFHDNPTAAKWLVEHPTEIGEAICKGICNHYGVAYKGEDEPKPNVLYLVQTGAFAKKEYAEAYAERIRAAGFDAIIKVKDDINGDGAVTAADARDLLRKVTGI